MTVRKLIFWSHLTVGSIAGVVILTMCVTGVLLAYQRQIVHIAERNFRVAPPPNAQPLPLESLLEKAHAVQAVPPTSITWRSNPTEPVEIALSRDQSLLLNPYTGAILGAGAVHTRAFFHLVEDTHRWLALASANRTTGRAITGACNLGFLFLVCSGPYLWLPRTWTRAAVKAGTTFNATLSGKARDFNWHNVIGFWCCIPLAAIVLCAVVMSYPWANNLVYRITNNPPPPPNSILQAARASTSSTSSPFSGLDLLRLRAEQRVPGWRTITLRLPSQPDANLTFSIDSGNGGRPDKRAQLTLNRKTAAEVRWEPFSSYNSGRRLRSWIRFTHTGEAAGLFGQTVAAIASLGGAFLVWTGLSLALRRLAKTVARASASAPALHPDAARPISPSIAREEIPTSENTAT